MSTTKTRSSVTTHIRPLADRVVVQRLELEKVSAGGIVIPDTAKEKPQQAQVVAVGPGRLNDAGIRIKPELRKKDHVLIGRYSGTEVKIDEDDFVILREEDILGIIEPDESGA